MSDPKSEPPQKGETLSSSIKLEDGTVGRVTELIKGLDSNGEPLSFQLDNSTKQKIDLGIYYAEGSDGKTYLLEPMVAHAKVVVRSGSYEPTPPVE